MIIVSDYLKVNYNRCNNLKVNYNIPLVADYIRGDCDSAITPLVYRCVKEYMMCEDRKKRCKGCMKVLSISKFPTYKKKDGENRGTENFCKKCRYTRDSKTTFKKTEVVELFINRTMYDMNGRDY